MKKSVLGLMLALTCAPLVACNQQHAAKREARMDRHRDQDDRTNMGDRDDRRGGRGHGLRRACAADLEKYCPGQERGRQRRECLQTHLDQLSADCKTAVSMRGGRHRKRDDF